MECMGSCCWQCVCAFHFHHHRMALWRTVCWYWSLVLNLKYVYEYLLVCYTIRSYKWKMILWNWLSLNIFINKIQTTSSLKYQTLRLLKILFPHSIFVTRYSNCTNTYISDRFTALEQRYMRQDVVRLFAWSVSCSQISLTQPRFLTGQGLWMCSQLHI